MYKGIIFDLDGTIADTLESISLAGNACLAEAGFEPRPKEEYKYYAGDGADTLVKRILAASGDEDGKHFEKAMNCYRSVFEENCMYEVKLYDGFRETAEYLKNIGIKLGVLTNKPHRAAVTLVETLFGKAFFDIILGQQEGLLKKPNPEGAIVIASHFGVSPSECIYVGDTNVDMQTGNAAGMYTVGVLWGFRGMDELISNGAHLLIKQPREIAELIVGR